MTQLGLYVGLFQLFVADKISHKGCFTQQARCPEMCVFLEGVGLGEPPRGTGHEGRHWRSWEMACVTPCTSGRSQECPTVPEGPGHPSPGLPFPEEHRAAATIPRPQQLQGGR